MGIQSWMIKSWPTLQWYLPPNPDDWPQFRHVSTQVREDRDARGRRIGDTVWLTSLEGESAGIAWEWTEFRPGVVVLSDPNSIVTNVQFLTRNNHEIETLEAAICLNRIAHVLPWQDDVCAVLRAPRGTEAPRRTPARPRIGRVDSGFGAMATA